MPVPGVERTAFAIAYLREIESARPDRLFDDPWARAFVDASGERRPDPARTSAGRGGPRAANWVTVRTRFVDDAVRAAGCRQVVLLGAGLDSRALRLSWPDGTTVYEMDAAGLLAFKDRVLDAAGIAPVPGAARRVPVAADVTAGVGAPLRAAGHDPAEPTVWVAEGLLLYLTTGECERLLAELGGLSPPGSRLVLTLTPPGRRDLDDAGPSGPNPYRVADGPADPAAWLATHGWTGHPIHPARTARTHNRTPLPDNADHLPPHHLPPHRHLIDAHRT